MSRIQQSPIQLSPNPWPPSASPPAARARATEPRSAAPFAALAAAALAAAVLLAGASTATAAQDPAEPSQSPRILVLEKAMVGQHLHLLAGDLEPADTLTVEDAGSFLVGETRVYWTEQGRRVDVTRESEDAFLIDIEGREVRIGSPSELAETGEQMKILRKRHQGDGEGSEVRIAVRRSPEPGDAGERELLKIELIEGTEGDDETRVRKRILIVPLTTE